MIAMRCGKKIIGMKKDDPLKPGRRCVRQEDGGGREPGPRDEYELLDSGDGRKYERFGEFKLVRPCAQAIWRAGKDSSQWQDAHATFDRTSGNRWRMETRLPEQWVITVAGIRFRLSTTDFGHLGIFPEQKDLWTWIAAMVEKAKKKTGRSVSVLNLFAYSGGSTMAAAKAGAEVWHVDASKGMVKWARENAGLNGLENAPIHWIVDDVNRFLEREIRRGKKYEAIILDPPTFGHGPRKEIYKIEEKLSSTMDKCRMLMSDSPAFILLSSHTPSLTPVALANILRSATRDFADSCIEHGEMLLAGRTDDVLPVPNGTFARWFRKFLSEEKP